MSRVESHIRVPTGGARRRGWIPRATLALVLCATGIAAILSSPPSPTWAGEGQAVKAPEFATWDVDGNQRKLVDFLNAKPILLEFMSPDCPHCIEMAPILTRLHVSYGNRVQFLSVAFDKNPKRVQRFAQAEKHTWPYLMGNQQIIDAYRLEGVPMFCFVAPDGRLVKGVVGSMPETTLREHIDALLKER